MTSININLAAAIARRTEAHTKHAADVEAVDRGRQRLAEAQAELQRLSGEDAAAIGRHAKRLEAQTREGKNGPIPSLVPSDKHLAAQIAADRTHTAAVQMVASLEAAERQSQAELAAAEQAVGAAADAVLAAEAVALASEAEHHLAEAERVGERLKLYVPDGFNTPINQLRTTPARVRQTLDRLDAAFRDDLNTPVWKLRGMPAVHSDFLAKRRASLIAGTAEGTDPAGTEQAAA